MKAKEIDIPWRGQFNPIVCVLWVTHTWGSVKCLLNDLVAEEV